MPPRGGSSSALFSLSTTTLLQYFFRSSSCCSVESTKPWNRNGVSVHGRSNSAMYMPKRSSDTGTLFLNANSLLGLKIIGHTVMESGTLSAVLKVVAVVVIGVPLLVYLLQERLIFMPQRLSDAALADIETRFAKGKSVFAQAADGTR